MWAALGLDLAAHDQLLGVLGPLYQDTFLGQPARPEGMKYFDFVMSEVHGLRIKELVDARAAGRIVVGSFCVFVPEELIVALDGVSVGLCAGAPWGLDEAHELLPRTTCALIKGAFGFALTRVCPYLAASDLVVGETTCDGKKKSYELFGDVIRERYGNELLVLEVPHCKAPADRALLKAEYRRLGARLEELSGRTLDVDRLRRGIAVVNAKRRALSRLTRLRAAEPAPISGLDALLAYQVSFYDDPVRFTASVEALNDELEARVARGEGVCPPGTPRVVISGCPMAVPNWKVPKLVEDAGAVIVGEESCVGERGLRNETDGTGETVDALLDALVDRYLAIDCAVFTPNPERVEHARALAVANRADGVLHYALQFCQPYQIESLPVARALERDGLPVLRVETDYSGEDLGQLGTRIEAFLEQLREAR
jgi:benzoyl-CoA reductase/2-hydroxyglutaryl-CoA dehydratase subunit BcrC/BadD/HgdB